MIVATCPATVSVKLEDGKLVTFTIATPPAGVPSNPVVEFTTGGIRLICCGVCGNTWKPEGCSRNCKPVLTVTSVAAIAAPGRTDTLATRWVGLNTHTWRTIKSLDPRPNVVRPSTKFVLAPCTSTIDSEPAGREAGLITMAGGPAGSYENVGGASCWTNNELWLSLLRAATFAT